MTTRRAIGPMFICALCAVSVVSARWLPPFGQVAPKVGTGRLAGVIVSDTSSPQPIRRATVRISGAGSAPRVVGTDDDGRFAFDALVAGSYTLSAAKNGFVQTYYGSPHPGRGPGVPIKLADAGRADVMLRMLPGAVITGTITDQSGAPKPGVAVVALDLRGARTNSASPASAVANDQGVYRIFGLPPSEYLVAALPRLMIQSEGRGLIGGVPISGVTDAEVQWARGAIGGAGSGGAIGPMPPAGPPVSYSPVYFPGTTDAAGAAPVTIAVGEERSGVNLALRIVPVAQLAGKLIDDAGQPVTSASVGVSMRNTGQPSAGSILMYNGMLNLPRATVTPAGFSIVGLSPGDYTLTARSGVLTRGSAPPSGAPTLWAVLDVVVDGRDRNDLLMRMLPGAIVSGSVAFDRSNLTPPSDLTKVELSFSTTSLVALNASSSRAVVDGAGTFRFPGVPPGGYAVRVAFPAAAGAAPGWVLKSAMYRGHDLADGSIDLKPGDVLDGVVVTLTDRPAEISGRVIDAAGHPVTRYSIVVFTTDGTLWLPYARRARLVLPAADGSFAVSGLPAGEYAVAAVEGADSTDLLDSAFLAQILGSAFKVTLGDGEKKVQDIRISGTAERDED